LGPKLWKTNPTGCYDIEALKREIQRLQKAKRRALAIADERSKEAVELRLENDRLRARLAECDHRR
jgi:regulator of replication initiation timing